MSCHDCGSILVKAGICQDCLTNLRYCGQCNQRRYFKNGRCEMCEAGKAELRALADEINQCLQIIVTNAGNWPIMSDKLKGSHSFRRERLEAIECLKNIESAVERAKK